MTKEGRREKRGDAIRQTSFGIVPGEESFMGMEIVWSRSSLSPSPHVGIGSRTQQKLL